MQAPLATFSQDHATRPGPRAGDARTVWTGVVCAVLSAAGLVLVVLEWAPLMRIDRSVAGALHRSAAEHPAWTRANRVLTDWVWDPWIMRALLAAAVCLLWRRDRLTALWLMVVGAVGAAVQQGLKAAVGRERPSWRHPVDSADYAAFPSGHAMSAALVCGLLLWVLRRNGLRGWWLRAARAVAVVSVVGVGFTRLYLGVHWLTDVVAGWLLGGALGAGAVAGYTRWEQRRPPRTPGGGGSRCPAGAGSRRRA